MKYTWIAAATAAVSLLTACGGGGDSTTSEPGVPITSTTQTLDASGGTVTLQGLSLAVPAAALAASTELGLQQEAVASPALARFRFSPAGQALATPAELSYSAPGLPANVRFFWEVNGERWMIPGSVSGGVLTSQVTSLGYTAAGNVAQAQANAQAALLTERVQAAAARVLPQADSASEGGSLAVAPVDCDVHIVELKIRLVRAATDGDQNRAAGVFNDLVATQEACVSVRVQELEQASCDALARAQSRAEVLVADSLNTFRELTVPLYAAEAFVESTGATCGNANPAANQALIEAKFHQLLEVMKGQMARAEFDDALTVRDLQLVMHLDTLCQKLDLGTVCTRLSGELYPDLLDALRRSAFEECRASGLPLAVSQFYALGSQAGFDEKFYGHGRFSLEAVEADLNYCSNPSLGLRVFDGATVPSELTDRATTLSPLGSLGNYLKTRAIDVPRDGSLNIAGTVGVLRCPDGSASGADLVLRINGREWVRRAASGNAYPLESAPLLLDLPDVLPGMGIDLVTNTGFTVTVSREGGVCSDGKQAVLDAPFTLFEVQVNQPSAGAFRGTLVFTQVSAYEQIQNGSSTITYTQSGRTEFSADVELVGSTRLNFTRVNASSTITSRVLRSVEVGVVTDSACQYALTTLGQTQVNSVSNTANPQDHATFEFNPSANTWALERLVFRAASTGVQSSSATYSNVTGFCEDVNTTGSALESPLAPSEDSISINFFDNQSPSGYLSGAITRNADGRRGMQHTGRFQNTSGGVTTITELTLNLNEAP